MIREIPGLPADVLGTFAQGQATETLESFHRDGSALQDTYRKAGESYEALMTEPRREVNTDVALPLFGRDGMIPLQTIEETAVVLCLLRRKRIGWCRL